MIEAEGVARPRMSIFLSPRMSLHKPLNQSIHQLTAFSTFPDRRMRSSKERESRGIEASDAQVNEEWYVRTCCYLLQAAEMARTLEPIRVVCKFASTIPLVLFLLLLSAPKVWVNFGPTIFLQLSNEQTQNLLKAGQFTTS